jgi:hypothetical protein
MYCVHSLQIPSMRHRYNEACNCDFFKLWFSERSCVTQILWELLSKSQQLLFLPKCGNTEMHSISHAIFTELAILFWNGSLETGTEFVREIAVLCKRNAWKCHAQLHETLGDCALLHWTVATWVQAFRSGKCQQLTCITMDMLKFTQAHISASREADDVWHLPHHGQQTKDNLGNYSGGCYKKECVKLICVVTFIPYSLYMPQQNDGTMLQKTWFACLLLLAPVCIPPCHGNTYKANAEYSEMCICHFLCCHILAKKQLPWLMEWPMYELFLSYFLQSLMQSAYQCGPFCCITWYMGNTMKSAPSEAFKCPLSPSTCLDCQVWIVFKGNFWLKCGVGRDDHSCTQFIISDLCLYKTTQWLVNPAL